MRIEGRDPFIRVNPGKSDHRILKNHEADATRPNRDEDEDDLPQWRDTGGRNAETMKALRYPIKNQSFRTGTMRRATMVTNDG
jgi:hypothetical protein